MSSAKFWTRNAINALTRDGRVPPLEVIIFTANGGAAHSGSTRSNVPFRISSQAMGSGCSAMPRLLFSASPNASPLWSFEHMAHALGERVHFKRLGYDFHAFCQEATAGGAFSVTGHEQDFQVGSSDASGVCELAPIEPR
jgi:hypothetical protein